MPNKIVLVGPEVFKCACERFGVNKDEGFVALATKSGVPIAVVPYMRNKAMVVSVLHEFEVDVFEEAVDLMDVFNLL